MGAVLAYIAHLYKVEKRARRSGIVGEDLRLLREHASQPVLEKLHEYLEKIREEVLPKSEAGQAVAYALKNWTALTRYLEDGDLSIDNNHTERSLRGIAVGRNNWTFVGSDRGGKTMAVLRSFVASCELAKVDPFAWFQDVLSRIGECSIQQLDELLPHRWAAGPRLADRSFGLPVPCRRCWCSCDGYVVEGLAQYYTSRVCDRLMLSAPEAKGAYEELLKHQPAAYQTHTPWLKKYKPEEVRFALVVARREGVMPIDRFESVLGAARSQLRWKEAEE